MLNWEELKIEDKLKKEGLIASLLKSEISNAEHNYMKYFDANVSNNTNTSNSTNDDTYNDAYDGKIRHKISDIRAILSRLGNIVTKNYRDKIKKRALWNRK